MKKAIKKKPALNELKLSSLNKQQLNQVSGGDDINDIILGSHGYQSSDPNDPLNDLTLEEQLVFSRAHHYPRPEEADLSPAVPTVSID